MSAELNTCAWCDTQIHRAPPHGDEPGRWIHVLGHRCPDAGGMIYGRTAEPANLTTTEGN